MMTIETHYYDLGLMTGGKMSRATAAVRMLDQNSDWLMGTLDAPSFLPSGSCISVGGIPTSSAFNREAEAKAQDEAYRDFDARR